MTDEHAHSQEVAESPEPPPAPPFYRRFIDVFFSPGRLMEVLAANPVWGAALLAVVLLVGAQAALIPADVYLEAQRQAILEGGGDVSQMPENMVGFIKIFAPIAAMISTVVMTFIFAGVYTLIFSFVLGDEGRYKQYLAVLTHSWLIPITLGLLLTPLKISTGDPQFTINLASFLPFLEEGYLYHVLRFMDLTQIWAAMVAAWGVHAIDRRRSWGSAAAILIGLQLVIALIVGFFAAR